MNEDFLPENIQKMALTQTSEEYQNNHYNHALSARDQIQWYIDSIRNVLNDMPFPCSDTLDIKMKKKIKTLQRKRDEQLKSLELSESVIKEDVNILLNTMAGSVNHKWDDYNLGQIVGFNLKTIKCSNNLIPLPIQSLFYVLILTYGYLVNQAINAMILKYEVTSLAEKDIPKKEMALFNELRKFSERLGETNNQIDDIKKGQEEIMRKIDVHDDKTSRAHARQEDKITKRNSAEKRKQLTQEDCASCLYRQKVVYFKKKEDYLRKVGITATIPKLPKDEKMVERTIQRWDQYIASNGEKGTEPPPGYSRERSEMEFERWAETLESIVFEKWKKRQPRLYQKKTDGCETMWTPEDEENLDEDSENFASRGKVSLVARFSHKTKQD